ncbi:MAG: NAD-dependent epimerase/dehydratase family protein [Actinomycetota bacterium]|nr:NAD-dependent epimerase/dehydratase family protein [Actinomycetota bacterium]
MKAPHCLVTGATGYIGGRLVPRLLAHGYPVQRWWWSGCLHR